MLQIGVDTGGTFTDFIWQDGSDWGRYKCLSTPHNPAEAVLHGLQRIAAGRGFTLVHGSTVATNAILERRGAKTALITNRGFEDVIEIARQNRPELYQLAVCKNPPLIPRNLRFGLPGRVDAGGRIIAAADAAAIKALIPLLQAAEVESLAVSCLFSFRNPEHEKMIRDHLAELKIPISLSHETLAEFREFERTSTTVINAYVSPKMSRYLEHLSQEIGSRPFRIMQSNGGSISAATARRESVRTILSGPAGGAVGARVVGANAGFNKLITFDMGGTSTDVALIDQRLPLTTEAAISGFPVKVPMIDIHTVGAGGGSIAAFDAGGALKVGPESAGADPGPICYGKGRAITVTDANLFLGRLVPDHFLGGGMALDQAALEEPFAKLAADLKLSPTAVAEGIIRVANITMERAIKVISVERGFDPREFTLFSFGGAGGLHAAELAHGLNMKAVMIPADPGILSAAGMLMADVIKDYSQTVMLDEEKLAEADLAALFAPLAERGRRDLVDEGVEAERIELEYFLDMRYRGQSYELMVPFDENFRETFHQRHRQTYGYSSPEKGLEVVNLRLRALGKPVKPQFKKLIAGNPEPPAAARLGEHRVYFAGRQRPAGLWRREEFKPGNRLAGPAIIVEYTSTIFLPPGSLAEVDEFGNLILNLEKMEEQGK